jgi:hypothetical protein
MKEMKKSEDIYNSVKGEIDKKKKKKNLTFYNYFGHNWSYKIILMWF